MSIIDQIAEIEKEVFGDAWSLESVRDSLGYDYNHFLVVTMDGQVFSDDRGGDKDTNSGEEQRAVNKQADSVEENIDDMIFEYNDGDRDAEIAGYILFSALDIVELQRIAVRESCRRRGFADKLMERFMDIVDGNDVSGILSESPDNDQMSIETRIILEVRAQNTPAINLYKKYSFKEISVRKNYYNNPVDDAIIMELVIRDNKK
ncbi:MAG: GNAT family N-acetyltransferase [Eubacterium sp.]|nr:GNAT family N-acetyltransferase [Eubacterium sp.]